MPRQPRGQTRRCSNQTPTNIERPVQAGFRIRKWVWHKIQHSWLPNFLFQEIAARSCSAENPSPIFVFSWKSQSEIIIFLEISVRISYLLEISARISHRKYPSQFIVYLEAEFEFLIAQEISGRIYYFPQPAFLDTVRVLCCCNPLPTEKVNSK